MTTRTAETGFGGSRTRRRGRVVAGLAAGLLTITTFGVTASPASAAEIVDTERPTTPTGLRGRAIDRGVLNLTWNPSTDNVAVAGYNIYNADTNTVLATSPDAGIVLTTADVLRAGRNRLYVKAFDAAGNESSRTNIVEIFLQMVADTERPSTPTGLRSAVAADHVINLTWNPSTDNVSVLGYRVYDANTDQVVIDNVRNPEASINWFDNGTYRLYVKAFDDAGNESWRSNIVTIVLSNVAADTERPSTPTGLRAGLTNVLWNLSTDNIAVAGYTVYDADSGAVLGTGFGPSLNPALGSAQLNYLDPGTYRVYVKAYDFAGNESWRSNIVTLTLRPA